MSKWIVITLLLLTACSAQEQSYAGVNFPADYAATFEHYATVDRGDATIRDLFISPHALQGLRSTGRLPHDSVLVIDLWQAVELRLLRRAARTWTKVVSPCWMRTGAITRRKCNPRCTWRCLTACFNCHQANARNDFVYSAQQLVRYAMSDTTQYFFWTGAITRRKCNPRCTWRTSAWTGVQRISAARRAPATGTSAPSSAKSGAHVDENLTACFNCHQANARKGMTSSTARSSWCATP